MFAFATPTFKLWMCVCAYMWKHVTRPQEVYSPYNGLMPVSSWKIFQRTCEHQDHRHLQSIPVSFIKAGRGLSVPCS